MPVTDYDVPSPSHRPTVRRQNLVVWEWRAGVVAEIDLTQPDPYTVALDEVGALVYTTAQGLRPHPATTAEPAIAGATGTVARGVST
jgi:hypothetical protein